MMPRAALWWPLAALVVALAVGMLVRSPPQPGEPDLPLAPGWQLPPVPDGASARQAARALVERAPWGDDSAAQGGNGDNQQAQAEIGDESEGVTVDTMAQWRFVGSVILGDERYGVFRSESGERQRLRSGEKLTDDLALVELELGAAVLAPADEDDWQPTDAIRLRLFRDTRFEVALPPPDARRSNGDIN